MLKLTSYILEKALRQLNVSESSLKQLEVVTNLSDVNGRGFPKELFELSFPMVTRGLLNFAVLQMRRDWVYPFWVHRQLDPKSESFVARSQNPLLINTTHRNWTAIGTPTGFYEAIVDPRGLATPLPREWSIDVWLLTPQAIFFPSLSNEVRQSFDVNSPRVVTRFNFGDIELGMEHFVGSTNHHLEVLFGRVFVKVAHTVSPLQASLYVCVRPFNPEGVAPIHSIEIKSRRFVYVDKTLGVVFAEAPTITFLSNGSRGDLSSTLRDFCKNNSKETSILCKDGLAHSASAFDFTLMPNKEEAVCYSVALAAPKKLRQSSVRLTWRVSSTKRREKHESSWSSETRSGTRYQFADQHLQNIFDASRSTLLMFHDGNFISPGPYIYHHFWFRDATMMVNALDALGFGKRSQQVIDAFSQRMTRKGFFSGPDGEWDSNGAVLWTFYQHYLKTDSIVWLRESYNDLLKAARWIKQMRSKSNNGLMPPSLSAEHLGTVDQYFWDSFWSLAGIKSFVRIARILKKKEEELEFLHESRSFEDAILRLLQTIEYESGKPFIPAAVMRGFDESAIGSICSIYPLRLFEGRLPHQKATIEALRQRFVDSRGFLHPFIHSGYNPYLTLQLAHSFLFLNNKTTAWEVADTVFRACQPPYSLPEAIHPKTGGGCMGDGHHGWSAAEIILFVRDCLIREENTSLSLLQDAGRLVEKGKPFAMENAPTSFGKVSLGLTFESERRARAEFSASFFSDRIPLHINIYFPFSVRRIIAPSPQHIIGVEGEDGITRVRCNSQVATLFLEL